MYREEENNQRIGQYKNSNEEYLYLDHINNVLTQTEEYIPNLTEKYPTVFVFGLPRSGTTLLYQFIAKYFEIGYFNNLMAKFWKAPLFSIKLARSLNLNQIPFSLDSHYGRTDEITGPHEFSYFFQDLFEMKSIERFVDFSETKINFDESYVRSVILNFQQEFDKALVFKTNFAVNYIHTINDLLDKSFFVYIQRDRLDVATSILKARKKFYGNYIKWWATYSKSYFAPHLSFEEQIFNQIDELEEIYEQKFKTIPDQKKILISYKDFCNEPQLIYKEIFDKLNALGPVEEKTNTDIPKKLRFSTNQTLKSREEKILHEYFKTKLK